MGPGKPKSNSPTKVDPPKPIYSGKTPTFSIFSGEEVPGKLKISFEQWLFKARNLQWTYFKSTFKEAIVGSLKGPATDLKCYLGYDVSVAKIISKLDTIYGHAASYDVLMQNYYKIKFDSKECVLAFATKMEGALN